MSFPNQIAKLAGKKMNLINLRIENFGPFNGSDHSIEFAHEDSTRNLTLFVGDQGAGKTFIFQLMYWIVFGDERDIIGKFEPQNRQFNFLPIGEFRDAINILTIQAEKEFRMGGSLDFQVITDGKPIAYRIERYRYYSNPMLDKDSIEETQYVLQIYQGDQRLSHPAAFLQKAFRPEIRELMFYHGESLICFLKNKRKVTSLIEILEEIQVKFEDKAREQVQEAATHFFKALVPAPEGWDRIEIVETGTGWDIMPFQSVERSRMDFPKSFETDLICISFLFALKKVLAFSLPLIYDSLFSPFPIEVNKSLAQNIPLWNDQVILFAKPESLRDIDKILLKSVGKHYRLTVDSGVNSMIEAQNITS